MNTDSKEVCEWIVESGIIKRIQYGKGYSDPSLALEKGSLKVEFVTGIGYSYYIPIECVGDLLYADDPSAHFEHHIVRKHSADCIRTHTSSGRDPAFGDTGRLSEYRNQRGMRDAIEEAKQNGHNSVVNFEWLANKHARVDQWIQRIAVFSHEVAEREKLRITSAAPLLAAEIEWEVPISWEVDWGFIRRITHQGKSYRLPNAPLPKVCLEIELITGIGYEYSVPIELVADLLVADDPNANFKHRIANEYGEDSYRTASSPGRDPAYGKSNRRSKRENKSAMNKAIEEAEMAKSRPFENSRWLKERELRLVQWTAKIAMFSTELAEKEKGRALASASLVAEKVAQKELKAEEMRVFWVNFWAKSNKQADKTNTCSPLQNIEKLEALVKAVTEDAQIQPSFSPSVLESEHQSTPQAKPCMASELLSQTVENNHLTGSPSKLEEPAILNSSDAAISAKPQTSTSHQKRPKSFRFLEEVWLLWFLVMVIITGYRVFVLGKKDGGLLFLVPAIIIICVFCISWIKQLFQKPNKAFADESSTSFAREINEILQNEDIICASPEILTHSDGYERFKPPSTNLPETRQDTEEGKETESIDSADVSVEDSNDTAHALENPSDEVMDSSGGEIHQLDPEPSEQESNAKEGLSSLYDNSENAQPEHPAPNSEPGKVVELNERVSLQWPQTVPEILPPTKAAKLPRQLRLMETRSPDIKPTEASPLVPTPGDEGQRKLRTNYQVVRNQKLREMAILIHGRDCCVCGFNFDKFFGESLARGYIEVHHLKNIADGERTTDPTTDLAPLCANCHAMADRLSKDLEHPPETIQELKALLIQH